ncbi:MAG TPA: hypothetical protein PLI01_09630 [Nitrospira sp.]|nr:hypothetical protein [Nitrospira sp.]HNE17937.1 hypothetical protein [Rhodocyclaceae bacterium]
MAAWRAVGRWIPAALRGLGCALLVLPAACSYLYVAPDGTRHVVGFVHLEIPPGNPAPWGGESLRVRSLGVSVSSSHESHALVLGYSDATHVAVRENACFAPEMAVSAEPVSPVEAPTVKE